MAGEKKIVRKYTYYGDATLDGQVTADDYLVLDANRNTAPPAGSGWIKGDMTNDGSVSADDYLVLDSNRSLAAGNRIDAPSSNSQNPASLCRNVSATTWTTI